MMTAISSDPGSTETVATVPVVGVGADVGQQVGEQLVQPQPVAEHHGAARNAGEPPGAAAGR